MSTGDEVFEPGADLPSGGIYDANRYSLLALLDGLGCDVTDLGILPDDQAAISEVLSMPILSMRKKPARTTPDTAPIVFSP